MNSIQKINFKKSPFLEIEGSIFPHKKMELWRHTDLSDIRENEYLQKNDLSKTKIEKFKNIINTRLQKINADHFVLLFVNGIIVEELTNLPKEITISKEELSSENNNYFANLSKRLSNKLTTGIHLKVKKNAQIEKPLHIFFCIDQEKTEKVIQAPNYKISIGEGAKLSLIENFITEKESESITIPSSVVTLDTASILDHGKIFFAGSESHFIQNQDFIIKKDAKLNSFHLNLGGNLSRYEGKVEMVEEGSQVFIGGISYIESAEQSNQYLEIHHKVPNTESEQYFKGILFDESHNVFRGKVVVDKMAKPINARQLTRNLLMSKKAHVDMQPQLEIYADDVKCQHGASIGQISDEELFYLQSRGISEEKAKNLLSMAFINDAFDRITNQDIKTFFIKLINKKMEERI